MPENPALVVRRRCAGIVAESSGEIPMLDGIVRASDFPKSTSDSRKGPSWNRSRPQHSQSDKAHTALNLPGKCAVSLGELA